MEKLGQLKEFGKNLGATAKKHKVLLITTFVGGAIAGHLGGNKTMQLAQKAGNKIRGRKPHA